MIFSSIPLLLFGRQKKKKRNRKKKSNEMNWKKENIVKVASAILWTVFSMGGFNDQPRTNIYWIQFNWIQFKLLIFDDDDDDMKHQTNTTMKKRYSNSTHLRLALVSERHEQKTFRWKEGTDVRMEMADMKKRKRATVDYRLRQL